MRNLSTNKYHSETDLSNILVLPNPNPNSVGAETFTYSVFKVISWIFDTTTKISNRVYFTPAHAEIYPPPPPPS